MRAPSAPCQIVVATAAVTLGLLLRCEDPGVMLPGELGESALGPGGADRDQLLSYTDYVIFESSILCDVVELAWLPSFSV